MTAAVSRALLCAAAAHALAPPPARAADPLTDGRRALAAGRWEDAEARLRKATQGPTRAEARLHLSDLLLLRGRAAEAKALARSAFDDPTTRSAGALRLGLALRRLGRLDEAITALRAGAAADPEGHAVAVALADALLGKGDHKAARRILEPMLHADDREAYRTAADLTSLGVAARLLGDVRFAFQALDEAAAADPADPAPLIELGRTALLAYDTIQAEQAFRQALKLRPGDPAAHLGLARVELEVARSYEPVISHVAEALKVDPTSPEAERLRAEVAILGERPDEAITTLERVLRADPHDLEAASLLAACHDALADARAFEATVARIGRLRKGYADVFTTAARFAERQNRYDDAIALARRALKTDPDHWPAHAVLGVQYTRTGREDEGRRHLERYYEHDDYDVRVTNLLNLYERWIGDYVWIEDPEVRIRVYKDEAAVARAVILPFARQMLARYDRRYGWRPPRPVTLELFHKPDIFALRSLGLPGVAMHGICFGNVVTARSPSSGDFNWGMVVAHELAHVYGLGASRHRVPRWFTEGMAEYETNVLRPEWTRRHGQVLHHALQAGRLPGVLDLSRAFTQGRSLGDVVVAYQQSALVVHHLVETAGYEAVAKAHGRFAKGQRLPEVIQALTGLPPEAFDRRFREWLAARVRGYAGNWDPDEALYLDAEPLRDAVKARPNDADARAALSAHFLGEKSMGAARIQAERALEIAPANPLAAYVAARAYMAEERGAEARPLLEGMIDGGHDGYVVRRALADLAVAAGDRAAAKAHLLRAAQLDPEQIRPRAGLAQIADQDGDAAGAREHLEAWAALDQNDPEPSRRLGALALTGGDDAEIGRWGEHLRFIAPYDADAHLLLGRSRLLAGAFDEADLAYAAALAADEDNADALAGRAQAALRLGRRDDAQAWARKALQAAPASDAAREVLDALQAPAGPP